jgi:hypothetical protein
LSVPRALCNHHGFKDDLTYSLFHGFYLRTPGGQIQVENGKNATRQQVIDYFRMVRELIRIGQLDHYLDLS